MPSGSSGSTTSSATAEPWSAQSPYLKNLFGYAQQGLTSPTLNVGGAPQSPAPMMGQAGQPGGSLADFTKMHPGLRPEQAMWQWQQQPKTSPQAPAPAPGGGQTGNGFLTPYTGISPETIAAQNLTTQRALMGSPVQNEAKGLLSDTLSGNYLDSNPHFNDALNNALSQVKSQVNSSFQKNGAYGGSANQQLLERELGKTATNAMAQNYDAERNRQMQGLLFAPQQAASDYADYAQLSGVGAQKEQQQAAAHDSTYAMLQRYLGLIKGDYGKTATQTDPLTSNPAMGILGGGIGGASIAPMLGMTGPWGAALGAGLGFLGSR